MGRGNYLWNYQTIVLSTTKQDEMVMNADQISRVLCHKSTQFNRSDPFDPRRDECGLIILLLTPEHTQLFNQL